MVDAIVFFNKILRCLSINRSIDSFNKFCMAASVDVTDQDK